MSQIAMTTSQRMRARRTMSVFGVFNTFSFFLLTGNIITLYLLTLGASSSFIGLISSFPYISYFFMLLGKLFVRRAGVVRVFAAGWLLRYVAMVPILFAPAVVAAGNPLGAYLLVMASALGFQAFRGVGLVGNAPVMGELSTGKDRGEFLARFQIITAVSSIVAGLTVAFLLGEQAPVGRYSVLIVCGILFGITAAVIILRIPEPGGTQEGAMESLFPAFIDALKRVQFRRFVVAFALFGAMSGMGRTFLIVYAKQAYMQPDSSAMLFAVIGSAGWFVMGFFARQVIDRLGAKPILVFFTGVFLVSVIPAVISPDVSGVLAALYIGLVFFFVTMGFTGGEYSAQTYFFGLVDQRDRLNLGIAYFFTLGFGGAIGSFAGGLLLDLLQTLGINTVVQFRIFFGAMAFALLLNVGLFARLERLGAKSVRGAMSVIFSLRDLRTISLLNRLDRTRSISGQKQVIHELATSNSRIAVEDILARLSSPSFVIRTEAIEALEQFPPTDAVVNALLREVRTQEYTTAYAAARLLGLKGVTSARGLLRERIRSEDYLLAAKSMVALARLGDTRSIGEIELIMTVTQNPLLLIHGAAALRIFESKSSIPVLLRIFGKPAVPAHVGNELILSLAGLLEIDEWFYPMFAAFLDDKAEGRELLEDYLTEGERQGRCNSAAGVKEAVREILHGEEGRCPAAHAEFLALEDTARDETFHALADSCLDQTLTGYDKYRYFLAAVLLRWSCSDGATASTKSIT